jgi:hypothetical protein
MSPDGRWIQGSPQKLNYRLKARKNGKFCFTSIPLRLKMSQNTGKMSLH